MLLVLKWPCWTIELNKMVSGDEYGKISVCNGACKSRADLSRTESQFQC